LKAIIAVFIGAGLGVLLRWWLSLTLNSYFPSIPPGRLAANPIGGYIIGVAIAFFAASTAKSGRNHAMGKPLPCPFCSTNRLLLIAPDPALPRECGESARRRARRDTGKAAL
jgi:hypothetical protein